MCLGGHLAIVWGKSLALGSQRGTLSDPSHWKMV